MAESRVLVAGATGLLGGAITRKLLAAGVPVRALGRNADKLASLRQAGAEVAAVDLMNLARLTEACRGIGQIVATANNVMGSGPTSPIRIDLTAYQNLCAAARNTGVRRLIYVSFRGVDQFAVVDFFRIKWYIEDAIRRSGVPHVMLRPSAFLDVWVDQVLAPGIRKKGAATVFGDGSNVSNYIAVDDVAEFAVRILAREDVVNEAVEVGGPSNLSIDDLATLVERRLGASGKRRHIPVLAMKYLPVLVRPFNELAARQMTLGLFAATEARPFPDWKKSADRFGVSPRTADAYVQAMTP
jgi:NADH dehydrogenase